ncbi:MAG: response regulator [Acidobacteriales bacterium]|nr:response regulator [Terriglobales bacterium]
MIADDEDGVLTTWRLILERAGYEVIAVANCADGLRALASRGPIDALISDLHMERQNIGLELARAALKQTPRPVVMLCTGFADVSNSRAALDMHVDYMATKPVELEELLAALASLLARRSAASSAAG